MDCSWHSDTTTFILKMKQKISWNRMLIWRMLFLKTLKSQFQGPILQTSLFMVIFLKENLLERSHICILNLISILKCDHLSDDKRKFNEISWIFYTQLQGYFWKFDNKNTQFSIRNFLKKTLQLVEFKQNNFKLQFIFKTQTTGSPRPIWPFVVL